MTPEQFCYWLQGIAEAGNTNVQPTPQQWAIIKDHLQTVFKKVTPNYNLPNPFPNPPIQPWNTPIGLTTNITC